MAAKASLIFGFECPEPKEYWMELSDRWIVGRAPDRPLSDDYQSEEWVQYREAFAAWKAYSFEHLQLLHSPEKDSYFLEVASLRRVCDAASVMLVPDHIPPHLDKIIQALKEFCEFAEIPCSSPRWHIALVDKDEIQ